MARENGGQRIYITVAVSAFVFVIASQIAGMNEHTGPHNEQVHNGAQSFDGYRISAVARARARASEQEEPHKKDNRACYRGKKELEDRDVGEG